MKAKRSRTRRRQVVTRTREDYEKGRIRCVECRVKLTLGRGPASLTCMLCNGEVCERCYEKHEGTQGRCR